MLGEVPSGSAQTAQAAISAATGQIVGSGLTKAGIAGTDIAAEGVQRTIEQTSDTLSNMGDEIQRGVENMRNGPQCPEAMCD
jgi:hypothetical protein